MQDLADSLKVAPQQSGDEVFAELKEDAPKENEQLNQTLASDPADAKHESPIDDTTASEWRTETVQPVALATRTIPNDKTTKKLKRPKPLVEGGNTTATAGEASVHQPTRPGKVERVIT